MSDLDDVGDVEIPAPGVTEIIKAMTEIEMAALRDCAMTLGRDTPFEESATVDVRLWPLCSCWGWPDRTKDGHAPSCPHGRKEPA